MDMRQNSILRNISDEKTLELINLYEQEPSLWNTMSTDYKKKKARQEAAERVCKQLDIKHFTARHIVTKFRNLRNSYCQELKKIESSKKAGDDPAYRPKVLWFNKMDSFIRPHLIQYGKKSYYRTPLKSKPPEPSETTESEDSIQLPNQQDTFIEKPSVKSKPPEPSETTESDGSIPNQQDTFIEKPSVKSEPLEPTESTEGEEIDQWANQNDAFIKNTLVKIEPPESTESEVIVELPNRKDVPIEETNDYSDSEEFEEEELPRKRSQSSSTASKRPRLEEFGESELMRMMKDISSRLHAMKNQKQDCYDTFGKYVAAMLRNMPVNEALEVQPQIVDLLVAKTLKNEKK